MLNKLEISVEPSVETNDHQARLIVDKKDWLGKDFAGLDPPMLRDQLSNPAGKLLVGRCWCGIVGCHDKLVEVARGDDLVKWRMNGGESLIFDAAQYDAELERFSHDSSWETTERAAEREINGIMHDTSMKKGFNFQWASARITEGFITLLYSKPAKNRDHHKLLKFEWDGVSVASAIERAKAFRAQRFPHLPDVDQDTC